MLFLHETHKVVGARHDEFEAAYREGWMPTLAQEDNARLLWYTNHAHGSGGLQRGHHHRYRRRRRVGEPGSSGAQGRPGPWMREMDNLRHEVTGKMLLPVAWSPLQDSGPGDRAHRWSTHPLSLFMEDTGWPHAPLDDYIRSWDEIYYRPLSQAPAGMRILEIQACFQVAHGS